MMQQPTGPNQPTNRATRRAMRRGRETNRRGRETMLYIGTFPPPRRPHASGALPPVHVTVLREGAPVALPPAPDGPFAWVVEDEAAAREFWHMLVTARGANCAAIASGQADGVWSINDKSSPRRLCWMLDVHTPTEGIPRAFQSFRGAEMEPASLHLLVTRDDAEQREDLVALLELGARKAPASEAEALVARAPEVAAEILGQLPHLVSLVHEPDALQAMYTRLMAASLARAALDSDGGRLVSAREVLRRVREEGEVPLPPAGFVMSGKCR